MVLKELGYLLFIEGELDFFFRYFRRVGYSFFLEISSRYFVLYGEGRGLREWV